jgi:hypothetical protein
VINEGMRVFQYFRNVVSLAGGTGGSMREMARERERERETGGILF